jgi:hypothetical protein
MLSAASREPLAGTINVVGPTKIPQADRLSGFIAIRAVVPPMDSAQWRVEAERLLEHIRRILSFGASTMLQAPLLEIAQGENMSSRSCR